MKKKILILFIALILVGGGLVVYFTSRDKETTPEVILPQISIFSSTIQEETSEYKIDVSYPLFSTSNEMSNANLQLKTEIQSWISDFKKSAHESAENKEIPIEAKSELDIHYDTITNENGIASVKLETFSYVRGAAHPLTTYTGYTYSFIHERELQLADFFAPGSDFLSALSPRAKEKIKTQLGENYLEEFAVEGLKPTAENFKEFVVGQNGLTLIFNVYQVAPYAAGPQFVTFSWGELKDLTENASVMMR